MDGIPDCRYLERHSANVRDWHPLMTGEQRFVRGIGRVSMVSDEWLGSCDRLCSRASWIRRHLQGACLFAQRCGGSSVTGPLLCDKEYGDDETAASNRHSDPRA